MKFPYELSKERLSLLTKEDRVIYEYEHSGLSPEMKKLEELDYNINLYNSLYNNINENIDDSDISESLFNSQFDELFDKELINEVGYEEYINIKKQIFEYIQNDHELKPLYEAPGEPADWWLSGIKLGWLGKLTAGLLTGLLGVVAWLMMKGKDRLAMKKLKQYMNKLVELVDQGVNKKKPWYAFLIPSKKGQQNTGDYNRSCFRTIQETAERNMACLYTSCIHDLGFLSPNITNFKSLVSETTAQEGSGLSIFEEKANSLNDILGTLTVSNDNGNKLLPFELDKSLFNSVKLPAVPTNYNMLMSDIDYPSKAKQNPNGSLFMKPTKEILQAKQSDIAQAYFRDASIENIVNKKAIQKKQEESILYAYLNNLYEAGVLTSDITGDIAGKEIKQGTLDREETKVQPFNGKITEAIDGYCRSAISIVNKLVKAICGKSSGQQMSKLNKTIAQLINAAEGHMSDFMKKEDSVLSKIISDSQDKTFRQMQGHIEATQRIADIQRWLNKDKDNDRLNSGDFTAALRGNNDNKKWNKKINKLLNLINDNSIDNKQLDIELKLLFNKNYSEINSLARNNGLLTENNYVNYNFYNSISEADEQHMDDTIANTDNMVLDNLHKTMDTTFNTVRNKLTEELAELLPTNTDDWYIITNSRERMKALKEAADKEINAKIELICRTASSANSDMGGKFKAAISKHPMRAESLKGIWSRYSDDLNDRMESRLRSITGDNGNSNILQTIEQFLTTTFPNLMAIMLQYKGLFYLVSLYTRNHPIDMQIDEVNIANKDSKLSSQILALEYFDNDND